MNRLLEIRRVYATSMLKSYKADDVVDFVYAIEDLRGNPVAWSDTREEAQELLERLSLNEEQIDFISDRFAEEAKAKYKKLLEIELSAVEMNRTLKKARLDLVGSGQLVDKELLDLTEVLDVKWETDELLRQYRGNSDGDV